MPPKPVRRPSHSTPPSVSSSRYADDDRYGNGRYTSPQYRQRVNRARTRAPSVDSQDTYYDPRDKYYLSGGDDDDSGWAPRRGRARQHPRRGRAASPSRSDSSSSRSPSPPPPYTSRASTDRTRARARSTPQHRNTRDSDRRRPRAAATSGRYRSPSPTRTRSTPAHNHNNRRRRRSPSISSSSSRSSSRSRSRSPSKGGGGGGGGGGGNKQSTFALAAHNAMEAAAIAALKLRHDPSPWLGAHKGGKIAAAALGAAVVDTLIARHAPHRKGGLRHTVAKQAAQMVIGGLVMPRQSGEAQKVRGWKGKVGGVGRGVARGMAGGGRRR